MKIIYRTESEIITIGEILCNHPMTVYEALEMIDFDIAEFAESFDYDYYNCFDWEAFEMVY